MGLAIVEDFIRNRSSELLADLSARGLALASLPPRLQRAVTVDAVKILAYQVGGLVRDSEDPLPLIQSTSRALASSSAPRMVIPRLALHWDASNIRVDHIEDALASFQVDRPWDSITDLSRRLGFAFPGHMKPVFRDSIANRHAAAHEADNDVVILDVRTFGRHALAVAICFDALLTRAVRLCRDQDAAYVSGTKVDQMSLGVRFLDDSGGGYAEHLGLGTPVIATYARVGQARSQAVRNARSAKQIVVLRDRNQTPNWWATTDL